MTGLAAGLVLFLVLGILGVVTAEQVGALIFVQYLMQLVAGYVGGRFGAPHTILHGSIAAILLVFLSTSITLAFASQRPSTIAIILGVLLAALFGAAGGALADRRLLPSGNSTPAD